MHILMQEINNFPVYRSFCTPNILKRLQLVNDV